jgi:hypothetical protein
LLRPIKEKLPWNKLNMNRRLIKTIAMETKTIAKGDNWDSGR